MTLPFCAWLRYDPAPRSDRAPPMSEVHFQVHPDGRRAFPAVVQYRVGDSVLDLPPTTESHRDKRKRACGPCRGSR